MTAPDKIWHIIDRKGKVSTDPDAHVMPCDGVKDAYDEYIRADLVPTWQPIETAPKDGTSILICTEGMKSPWSARWEKMRRVPDRWVSAGIGAVPFDPSFWQPLPTPPEPDT